MRWPGLFLLLVWLSAGAWADLERPKLKDVKVWYYAVQEEPQTLVWWTKQGLRVANRGLFSTRGKFRIRVEVEGGFEKEGEVVNYLGIVFRDQNAVSYQIPFDYALTRGGVKDVYWEPPLWVRPGEVDFQVVAWTGTLPRITKLTKVADRTELFQLGAFETP